jgi:hypothetical protein
MNHALIESSPGELGVGCKCGKRFPTRKTAEGHVTDQNLIEANEAKAKAAAVELEHQAKEPVDREATDEAAKADVHESRPEPAATPAPTEAPNAAHVSPEVVQKIRRQGNFRSCGGC